VSSSTPTAAIIVIGNEILSGRTPDENLPYLARRLAELGIELCEARVVRDCETDIVQAVNACRLRYTYILTTGGIGPTHDDITTASIATAFRVKIARHAEAERRLGSYYGGAHLNAARLRMADLPVGAQLIDNPVSQAPGFQFDNVYVLPGVPSIMRAMFEGLSTRLQGGTPQLVRTLTTALSESRFAEGLGSIQAQHPGVAIGSYPYAKQGRYGVSLVMRGVDPQELDKTTTAVKDLLVYLGDTMEGPG
jgi:molybdenum cofactor synthesis domain-containing protein